MPAVSLRAVSGGLTPRTSVEGRAAEAEAPRGKKAASVELEADGAALSEASVMGALPFGSIRESTGPPTPTSLGPEAPEVARPAEVFVHGTAVPFAPQVSPVLDLLTKRVAKANSIKAAAETRQLAADSAACEENGGVGVGAAIAAAATAAAAAARGLTEAGGSTDGRGSSRESSFKTPAPATDEAKSGPKSSRWPWG